MPRVHNPLIRLLGFIAQGDLGPLTLYTKPRERIVAFLKAPPDKPASQWQRATRNRWRLALTRWRALPPAIKAQWALAARRAHCRATGLNVFISAAVKSDRSVIRTIARQSGVPIT